MLPFEKTGDGEGDQVAIERNDTLALTRLRGHQSGKSRGSSARARGHSFCSPCSPSRAKEGIHMKRLLLTALAFGAPMMPAMAADMAPYYKGPVMAPAWSWTGVYFGGDVGGAFSSSNATWTPITLPPGFGFPAVPISNVDTGGSSFAGGFFAGYIITTNSHPPLWPASKVIGPG
jgi:hypothetical protein